MEPMRNPRETRSLGKPVDWDESKQGTCGFLSIADRIGPGGPQMQSHWRPTASELEQLNAGFVVVLTLFGEMHPPVALMMTNDTAQVPAL